jgi:hypothetical protein
MPLPLALEAAAVAQGGRRHLQLEQAEQEPRVKVLMVGQAVVLKHAAQVAAVVPEVPVRWSRLAMG